MAKLFRKNAEKLFIDRNTALALALLPGVILMVLQVIFLEYNVYLWYFPQLDIFMHIMGGASVAWAVFALTNYAQISGKLPKLPFWFSVIFCVGAAITVGVLWEFYEFMNDIFLNTEEQLSRFGVGDTMKDLSNDLLGAFVASMIFEKYNRLIKK